MPQPVGIPGEYWDGLAVGMRVSLRAGDAPGRREVIGFVTALSADALTVVDRHGTEHAQARAGVEAIRQVGVALGRRPESTPRHLLDALADRAGASGSCWVARISTLLAGRTPPASVPAWGAWADLGGVRARFEGEWVTLPSAPLPTLVDAAWWATRMGARSVQVRVREDDRAVAGHLAGAGFTALDLTPPS
ncbi:MAG: hypothetical protein IPL36_04745 [Nigerium sp.]|nr:hypothetical protein [Nigerium sp.]